VRSPRLLHRNDIHSRETKYSKTVAQYSFHNYEDLTLVL